ncbi:MAG: hypothetical protein ABIO84_05465 [Lysobacter sp.]
MKPTRSLRALTALSVLLLAGTAHAASVATPADPVATATTVDEPAALDARTIVSRAHEVAGGAAWQRPVTLHLRGRALLYEDGVLDTRTVAERWEMWRVFPMWNTTAHGPSGKVRVEGASNGKLLFQVSFDGTNTYDRNGLVPGAKASAEWAEAFGFGIIRFALDDGFSLTRLADDQVEGHPSYNVAVKDPSGSSTLFWIDSASHVIRKVGFDTPRGWHERIYSGFEYHQNPRFMQATRVRLYYKGALTNDITWEQYAINAPIADAVFVLAGKPATAGDVSGDRSAPAPAPAQTTSPSSMRTQDGAR